MDSYSDVNIFLSFPPVEDMHAKSKQAKAHSPTLARLLKARPAPSRETKLFEAALSDTRPVKPPPGECCGSSCDPCVMDLYAQELKVWKECKEWRESERGVVADESSEPSGTTESSSTKTLGYKIPGAFEW
ncbi:hypothetical protein Q7P37_011463 [Cladosporium fusiforme]